MGSRRRGSQGQDLRGHDKPKRPDVVGGRNQLTPCMAGNKIASGVTRCFPSRYFLSNAGVAQW